jgi:cadmium resistance protein CadD (predicted permease)
VTVDGEDGGKPVNTGWYVGFGILYLVLLLTLAVTSFRKGHWILGLIGFFFPVLWLVGALLPRVR